MAEWAGECKRKAAAPDIAMMYSALRMFNPACGRLSARCQFAAVICDVPHFLAALLKFIKED